MEKQAHPISLLSRRKADKFGAHHPTGIQ